MKLDTNIFENLDKYKKKWCKNILEFGQTQMKLDTNIFENSDKYKIKVDRNIFPSLSPCLPADELPSCHQTVGRLPWIRLNDGHVSKKVWPPDIHQHFYSKKSINGLILTSPRLPFIFLSTKKTPPSSPFRPWDFYGIERILEDLDCRWNAT